MMKRLRKAFNWAENLRSIAHQTATPETILEAEAYASYLYGTIAMEEEAWPDAAGALALTIKIFETLKTKQNGAGLHAYSSFLQELYAILSFCKRESQRHEMKKECSNAIAREEKRSETLVTTHIGQGASSKSEMTAPDDLTDDDRHGKAKIESRINVNKIFFGGRWFDVTSAELRKALEKAQRMDIQLVREQTRKHASPSQQQSSGATSGTLSQDEKLYLDTLSAIDDVIKKSRHEKEDPDTAEALVSCITATKLELMHQNVISVFGTTWKQLEKNLAVNRGLTQALPSSPEKQIATVRQSIEKLLGLCSRAQRTIDEMGSICENYSGGSKSVFNYMAVIQARKLSIESISVLGKALAYAHSAAVCVTRALDPSQSNTSRKQNAKQAPTMASKSASLFALTKERTSRAADAWRSVDVKDPGHAVFGSVSESENQELGGQAIEFYSSKSGKYDKALQYLMTLHELCADKSFLFPSDACLPFGVRLDSSSTDSLVKANLQAEGQRVRPIPLVHRISPEVASTMDPFTDMDYVAPSKPHAEPIPSKPLHFDVAHDYLEAPELSHRLPSQQAARPPPCPAATVTSDRPDESNQDESEGSVFSSALSWLTGR